MNRLLILLLCGSAHGLPISEGVIPASLDSVDDATLIPEKCVISRYARHTGVDWDALVTVTNRRDVADFFSLCTSSNLVPTTATLSGLVCKLSFLNGNHSDFLNVTVYGDGVFALTRSEGDIESEEETSSTDMMYICVKASEEAYDVIGLCRNYISDHIEDYENWRNDKGRDPWEWVGLPVTPWSPPRVTMPAEWYNYSDGSGESILRRLEIEMECCKIAVSLTTAAEERKTYMLGLLHQWRQSAQQLQKVVAESSRQDVSSRGGTQDASVGVMAAGHQESIPKIPLTSADTERILRDTIIENLEIADEPFRSAFMKIAEAAKLTEHGVVLRVLLGPRGEDIMPSASLSNGRSRFTYHSKASSVASVLDVLCNLGMLKWVVRGGEVIIAPDPSDA